MVRRVDYSVDLRPLLKEQVLIQAGYQKNTFGSGDKSQAQLRTEDTQNKAGISNARISQQFCLQQLLEDKKASKATRLASNSEIHNNMGKGDDGYGNKTLVLAA